MINDQFLWMNRVPKDVIRIIGKYVHSSEWKAVMKELWIKTYLIRVGFELLGYMLLPAVGRIVNMDRLLIARKFIYEPPGWDYKYSKCWVCNKWRIATFSFRIKRNHRCCG